MRVYNIEKDVLDKLYHIGRDGAISRKSDGYTFKQTKDPKGYCRLRLPYPNATSKDGRYQFKVHRLVAMFHLDDYTEDLQVNHKNGNKQDNRVENLEMVTCRENILHSWRVLDSSERRRKLKETIKARLSSKRIDN